MSRRGAPARPWSWLQDMPRRARLEAGARRAYSDLRSARLRGTHGTRTRYCAQVVIPGYESRLVTIEFEHTNPLSPHIFADGPSGYDDSPHRYATRGRTRLCIWYPSDPSDRKWVPDDGLLVLFGMAAEHLFKEAWWRETDEWLGDEHSHDPDDEAPA